jgi:uncharacterized protein with PIN domain
VVIDTSAVVTVLQGEPGAQQLEAVFNKHPARFMSAATLAECALVMEG